LSQPPTQLANSVVLPSAVKLVSIYQALVVAEHLSFSQAAQALGIRQSTVSRHVRALEDQLGVSLFERDSKGVRPTEAGRRFLDRTRCGLIEIDHAVKVAADAGRGKEGTLRLGIMSSVSKGLLHDLLRQFHGAHPAVAISVAEGSGQEHIAHIIGRQIDVAFITGTPPAARCETMILWKASIYAALPEGHPLADAASIDWSALKDEHFIVSRRAPRPEIHDYIVRRAAALGFSPWVERYNVSREILMLLVGLGFGISLASEPATAIQYPDVILRPLTASEDVSPYSGIWLPGNDNPALRRFLSLARQRRDRRR
jgi:DNA-binding transcriptional LysR family regulator